MPPKESDLVVEPPLVVGDSGPSDVDGGASELASDGAISHESAAAAAGALAVSTSADSGAAEGPAIASTPEALKSEPAALEASTGMAAGADTSEAASCCSTYGLRMRPISASLGTP
jgi:hypothetical protein